MTVGAGISVSDGNLVVLGTPILSDVHDNIILTPAGGNGLINGAFIGVTSDHGGSRRVFPVGKLDGLRFMCAFRFKVWWMTQRMGSSGKDIPFETQFLIIEGNDGSHIGDGSEDGSAPALYVVLLPILEGAFRAVLQGNANNEIEICLESVRIKWVDEEFDDGSLPRIVEDSGLLMGTQNLLLWPGKKFFFEHATFSHREKKKMPDMLNWFGWCTWDAFYTDVTAEGVRRGLQCLQQGGIHPKFVIIDDGWQSVGMDDTGIASKMQDAAKLTNIKENHKFQKNGKEGHREEDLTLGLKHIVSEIKEKHDLKYVYVWHAITGYWGGVRPGVTGMEHYESKMTYPVSSPGIQSNEPCIVISSIETNGLGLVNPEKVFNFYDELHSYLASAGINGVKVDVQNILETLGAGHGGRVRLARKYHQALEASISRNFPDNGIISCMSHSTDGLYSAKRTAVVRASDDFWPKDPASHTIHIASVAYNTLFLGEFMQPDWDMFHSLHPMAEYHGAARAVGGCAIYVRQKTIPCSDKPGQHDFNLLKKLVLPDGSILRARLPGRPTRDCLFSDPARDGKSLLKIWNLNDFSGVVGVFNCQGAGWCRVGKTNLIHDHQPCTITGVVRSKDVAYLPKIADNGWNGDSVLYSHLGGEVFYLPKDVSLPVTLKSREYEVFTVVPVKQLSNGASFAPIGLIKMFNSGGAVKELRHEAERSSMVKMKVRGCGVFGAYSSIRPKRITVDEEEAEFTFDERFGLVSLVLRVPNEELYVWTVRVEL
ncbi:flavodoxin-like fold protein [Asimina triloba]